MADNLLIVLSESATPVLANLVIRGMRLCRHKASNELCIAVVTNLVSNI
jgi:uncharacterized protein YejL (UPF0352 family)